MTPTHTRHTCTICIYWTKNKKYIVGDTDPFLKLLHLNFATSFSFVTQRSWHDACYILQPSGAELVLHQAEPQPSPGGANTTLKFPFGHVLAFVELYSDWFKCFSNDCIIEYSVFVSSKVPSHTLFQHTNWLSGALVSPAAVTAKNSHGGCGCISIVAFSKTENHISTTIAIYRNFHCKAKVHRCNETFSLISLSNSPSRPLTWNCIRSVFHDTFEMYFYKDTFRGKKQLTQASKPFSYISEGLKSFAVSINSFFFLLQNTAQL